MIKHLAIALACAALGCQSASLQQPSDTTGGGCPSYAVYCDAAAPGEGGCTGDGTDGMPTTTTYPVGCGGAILSGVRGSGGHCELERSCTCDPVDAGAAWHCQ